MRTKYSILALALLILFGCTTKEEKVNLPSIEEKAIVPKSDSRLQRAFRLNSSIGSRGNQNIVSNMKLNGKIDFDTRAKFLAYINEVRRDGTNCAPPAPPLEMHEKLNLSAQAHAEDMAKSGKRLSHSGSGQNTDFASKGDGSGSTFFERILYFGYPAKAYDLIGETLTFTKHTKVKSKKVDAHFRRAMHIFINHYPHCRILMDPRFQHIGIGFSQNDKGYYWVLNFAENREDDQSTAKEPLFTRNY